jgi:hypothetical protein
MRITVKIEDIEVTIDRPNIKEADRVDGDIKMTKEVVLPTLEAAVKHAQSMYTQKKCY